MAAPRCFTLPGAAWRKPFVVGSDASHLRARERARFELGPSEKRVWLFYLTSFDYSRNKEAKLVPFLKRLAIVESVKETH
jgi:hypothetical protein